MLDLDRERPKDDARHHGFGSSFTRTAGVLTALIVVPTVLCCAGPLIVATVGNLATALLEPVEQAEPGK